MRARCGWLLAAALVLTGAPTTAVGGPYAELGHTASGMTAWATAVDEIVRGALDHAQPGLGEASYGEAAFVVGPASADPSLVLSLGDGGSTTLFFQSAIADGPNDDFAVFENGFTNIFGEIFAEFAFVEVSSDGTTFARFETDTVQSVAVGPFDYLDPTNYSGLAGKHEIGFGTGFDLAELAMHPLVQNGAIDLYDIQYVRLVDAIGDGSTTDADGDPIYDPYATPFAVGGFDLDAVGVIHTPEPKLAAGLGLGLMLLFALARRRPAPPSRRSVQLLSVVLAFAAASPAAALTATFEDLGLGVEDFENGSGLAGGYTSGGLFFENSYSQSEFGGQIFESFTGFAASTTTDNTTPGFGNQFSAFPGSGSGGSGAYGLAFGSGRIVLPTVQRVLAADISNTTYAALSMLNGDAFAKQFGGATGDDPDFFRLIIEGRDANDASTGTLDFMLADYRFADNSLDFVVDEWVTFDLSGLGDVKELLFSFESSDVGAFGINTPQYFAIDNLVTVPEPGTALLLGFGLALASSSRRRPLVSIR